MLMNIRMHEAVNEVAELKFEGKSNSFQLWH